MRKTLLFLGRIILGLVGLILAALVIGPFLIPIPPLKNTMDPEKLAGPTSHFLVVNGVKVHYQEAGSGFPVIVLLHGFAASTFSWREVLPSLAQKARVVAFDRPAFGLTERPLRWEGVNPYSTEGQVGMTVQLFDRLGIEQAVLVGNSAGGTLAIEVALQYPQRVAALVLVDAAVYTRAGESDWLQPVFHTPQMQRLGPWLVRNIQSWGDDFARSAWHDPSKITPEIWAGYHLPLQAQDWDRGLWQLVLAGNNKNLPERLHELVSPTLVITGDDDRIVPTEQSLQLAREIPNARLVVIPQCGHIPQEECPEAFLEAVNRFLLDNFQGKK